MNLGQMFSLSVESISILISIVNGEWTLKYLLNKMSIYEMFEKNGFE